MWNWLSCAAANTKFWKPESITDYINQAFIAG